ncbi:trehalose operon repressor [Bacillus marinisedimentorum]|uniref:trehalose operon repressor n=1 Tax=Bacillus marinisedimentorum TaxID=1821260 RepID=UPI0007E052F5|nr:trehalose operon repressor [Bacillus marinisedimentorum]
MNNKYKIIYQEISEQIESGKMKPDTKLPSEHELMDMYGVSRETIRKALNLLAQNGFIQKIRGKGSIVLDLKRYDFPVSGMVSFRELADKMGQSTRTIVKELGILEPDDYLQEQLQIKGNEDVWKVVRVREIDGEKVILDKDFFLTSFVPELTKRACEHSIYEYLEDEKGLEISFAKKVISVEEPGEEDRRLLDFKDYHAVVVVRNYVYLKSADLFQYTESRHRPDKFRFVDFARREQKR